jgi:hypothetical protein
MNTNDNEQKMGEGYYCKTCYYYAYDKYKMERHMSTIKHQKNMNTNENEQKIGGEYYCEQCNYYTSRQNNITRHKLTAKHQKLTNTNESEQKRAKKGGTENKVYSCECGKRYMHKPSLYNHYKTCDRNNKNKNEDKCENEIVNYKELFMVIIEQMKEQGEQNKALHTTLIDLIPKINNTNNANNTNCNNNTINQNVNINMFLNENCKDAISMDDFVKSIEITVNDLLYTKNNGLINGMSNIFMENLNRLPLIKRPLWCSDKKRRRIFIKEDKWKEDSNNAKTKTAIKNVGALQLKNVKNFIKDKPNWIHNESDKDNYMAIVKHATEPIEGNEDKVIDGIIGSIHLSNDKKTEIAN